MKKRIYTGAPWEERVAYCRALSAGNHAVVSGTTAVDENGEIIGEDMYSQSSFIFKKIQTALQELGFSLTDVVRTRSFVTDINQFEGFAKAHREFFAGIDPVASCLEISGLVNDKLLIEVEVDAIKESSND